MPCPQPSPPSLAPNYLSLSYILGFLSLVYVIAERRPPLAPLKTLRLEREPVDLHSFPAVDRIIKFPIGAFPFLVRKVSDTMATLKSRWILPYWSIIAASLIHATRKGYPQKANSQRYRFHCEHIFLSEPHLFRSLS